MEEIPEELKNKTITCFYCHYKNVNTHYCSKCNNDLVQQCLNPGIYSFNGLLGDSLIVYQDKVIIAHNSPYKSRVEKTIYLSNITAVQLRKPTTFKYGYIQFTIPGGGENAVVDKLYINDNCVTFTNHTTTENAEEIVEYLNRRIQELQNTTQNSNSYQISSADEIKKYKELLDNGIITQEEFEAKKRQLLGI